MYIRIYTTGTRCTRQPYCLPVEAMTDNLHGAKVQATCRARGFGLKPVTRQWITCILGKLIPELPVLCYRFYQDSQGKELLIVITSETPAEVCNP